MLLIYFLYSFYIPFYNILTYMTIEVTGLGMTSLGLIDTYIYTSSPTGLIISALIKPFMIRYCSIVFTQFSTPTRSLFSVRS